MKNYLPRLLPEKINLERAITLKNDMYDFPERLYEFAQIPDFHNVISQLKSLSEEEDWCYHAIVPSPGVIYPILENFINNTYKRIAVEKKISYSRDKLYCCFDTGLLTELQREPIYMQFKENSNPTVECFWHFDRYFRRGEHYVNQFEKLPEMAFYWEDPSKLIYDTRKEIIVNIEHIIQDNKNRFPAPYNTMADYNLQMYLDGCIKLSVDKLRRNYKIAVPQYFLTSNTIQLLIPLCLCNPGIADMAIVVEDYGTMYRASTCLTLDLAINNARLVARPDRDWLNP